MNNYSIFCIYQSDKKDNYTPIEIFSDCIWIESDDIKEKLAHYLGGARIQDVDDLEGYLKHLGKVFGISFIYLMSISTFNKLLLTRPTISEFNDAFKSFAHMSYGSKGKE